MARTKHSKYLVVMIAGLYLMMAVIGARAALRLPEGGVDILISLIVAILMTLICVTDGRMGGKPINTFSRWLIFFGWPIAVPVCLVRTRGIKGLGMVFLHAAGMVIVGIVTCVAIDYLVSR